jgi:hypothetical protein
LEPSALSKDIGTTTTSDTIHSMRAGTLDGLCAQFPGIAPVLAASAQSIRDLLTDKHGLQLRLTNLPRGYGYWPGPNLKSPGS